jgi:outer membrane protein assembly factor BamB
VFYIRDKDKASVCANCHGATDGEALVASVEDSLSQLGAKIAQSVKTKLNAATAAAPVYFKSVYLLDDQGVTVKDASGAEVTANFVYDGTNKYTSVAIEEVHGQVGHVYKFTSPITFTAGGKSYTVKAFEVGMGGLFTNSAMNSAVYALSGNLVRAGWNYFLIEGDQSKGIHNPTFVRNVLNATLAKDLSN